MNVRLPSSIYVLILLAALSGCGPADPYYTLDIPEAGEAVVTIHTKEGKTERVAFQYLKLEKPTESFNADRPMESRTMIEGKAEVKYTSPPLVIESVTYDGQSLKQRKPM